jgi:hypothetical protein
VEAPSTRAALGLGWRAAAESAWLAPVGMVVALARSALALPAWAFAVAVVLRGAAFGFRQDPAGEGALLGGIEALASPRLAATLAGLWLSAALLSAAVRVAYLAGALPTLGRTLSGARDAPPAFATGFAFRFPRLAGTALLVFLVELAGGLFAWTIYLGAFLATSRAESLPAPVLAAFLVAAGLTLALLVPFALSTLGDAALARAALRDDAPLRAVARAAARLAERPGAFLLAALAVAFFGLLVTGSLQAVATLATSLARARGGWLALGPELMVAALATLLASWVELWRLGTLATLACAPSGDSDRGARPGALTS